MRDFLTPALAPLERVTLFTPLGIRFWDAARDAEAGEGLVVRARRPAAPLLTSTAIRTRSGVYAFFGLPGMRAVEYPPEPPSGVSSPPPTERFIVDVVDRERRFVPIAFPVDVPHEGVFPSTPGGSPPGNGPPGFYLFSAATRTVPGVQAVVRATLAEQATGAPAAHAVLEVGLPGGWRAFGVADAAGQVVAHFAYPRFEPTVTSPPQSAEAARALPSWPITVQVRYAPGGQTTLLPTLPPDLGSLFAQIGAPVWPAAAGPPTPQLDATLVFGRELVLRTDEEPVLLVG